MPPFFYFLHNACLTPMVPFTLFDPLLRSSVLSPCLMTLFVSPDNCVPCLSVSISQCMLGERVNVLPTPRQSCKGDKCAKSQFESPKDNSAHNALPFPSDATM